MNIKSFSGPLLSGILIGTSYIPFPPWAYLFCFVPLWLFWLKPERRLREIIISGVLTSFIFTLIGFNWFAYMMHEFAHLDWFSSVLALIAFALLAHPFVWVSGWVWFYANRWLRLGTLGQVTLIAVLTILFEASIPTVFDWDFGYSWFAAGVPIYQLAEWIGFSGLSSLTILANVPILIIWSTRKDIHAMRSVGWVLLTFLSLNGLGFWLRHHQPPPDDQAKVMLVQGNIGNAEKVSAELGMGFQEAILKAFMQTTDQGLSKIPTSSSLDFVIWPETAFPSVLGRGLRPTSDAETLKQFIATRHINLITGAYGFDRSKGLMTNSLFVLDRSGTVVEPHYSKTILLAFGEFIPGEELWPGIRNYLPPIGQFARGPGPTVLLTHDRFLMGPQICYESLFAWFSRDLANLGAQFIVNVTNDSWYGYWQEPYQHLYMTLARAIEFRRPVIRTTNTGISTVVLADGTVLERSPINEAWAGVYDVPFIREPRATFYQRHLHLMTGFSLLLLAGVVVSGARYRYLRA